MYEESIVGNLFKEGVNHYPEGARFDISDDGCNLSLYFSRPTDKEINLIKTSSIKVGCYMEDEVIMMLFKFENMNWMDAPYSIHLSKNLRYLPDLLSNEGYQLNVYLIDARTGILKAKRVVNLKDTFSKSLKRIIEKQKEIPFNKHQYAIKIGDIYSKYSTKELTNFMFSYCTVNKCNE